MNAEIVGLLGEHRMVYDSDGDYGEMSWVECSCGDEYFVGTDLANESDHRAHLASVLEAWAGEQVRAAVVVALESIGRRAAQDRMRLQSGASVAAWLYGQANPYRADKEGDS